MPMKLYFCHTDQAVARYMKYRFLVLTMAIFIIFKARVKAVKMLVLDSIALHPLESLESHSSYLVQSLVNADLLHKLLQLFTPSVMLDHEMRDSCQH